jgi:hypothetical protein
MSAIPHSKNWTTTAKPRVRVVHKKPHPLILFMAYCLLISMAAIIFAGVVRFFGHLLIEEMRTETIAAEQQAQNAEEATLLIKKQIDQITSASVVERWAILNGFQPTFALSINDDVFAQR